MTICVAIKVHDCIVFAADSASTLSGADANGNAVVSNVWRHGVKVFNLHKGLPLAAMTCGMGHFGPASISNLAKDLRLELSSGGAREIDPATYTIEQATQHAFEFFEQQYRSLPAPPANPHRFEFWVGGYGANGARGEIRKIVFDNGNLLPPEVVANQTDDAQVAWAGQPQPINRLLLGFDPKLGEFLAQHGMDQARIDLVVNALQARTATPLVHATMPVIDAIALADFLVDVTTRYFAFLPGADLVGGDADIATVTKHEGFKWIRRKHYYPRDLNPRETGHAGE